MVQHQPAALTQRDCNHRIGTRKMRTLTIKTIELSQDKRGVTALEYGIIAGVLGLALIAIFNTFGGSLSTLMGGIGGSI
jgi:Flp pilus assembly pilin Flp